MDNKIKTMDELEVAARPLIKYLNEHHLPHTTILVTSRSVEVLEGVASIPNITDYITD